ncbi:hypothetical protein ACFQ1S_23630 [Kibdelosporangium lantanae]|uniref:Uncharacterized protein n=1 Tax=Kibdelosporangium lantanae TaxID=1497396 RepID=A0ABW3MDU4_9PSEU
MSNGNLYLVASGTEVTEAFPLFNRLVEVAWPGSGRSLDITIADVSSAVPHHRGLLASASYELHVPASQLGVFTSVLKPLITDSVRQGGIDDGDGGEWIAVHYDESDALDALATLPSVPVEINAYDLAVETFDWRLVPPYPARASVRMDVHWPAMGDLGPHGKHAAVCLFTNNQNLWDLDPGDPGYGLYVLTERNGLSRATQIAEATGLTVLDGPFPD